MKTAELVKKCQDRMKSIRDKIETKRKSKKVYSEEDMLLFAKFVYEDDGSCVDNNGNVKKDTLEQFKNK